MKSVLESPMGEQTVQTRRSGMQASKEVHRVDLDHDQVRDCIDDPVGRPRIAEWSHCRSPVSGLFNCFSELDAYPTGAGIGN